MAGLALAGCLFGAAASPGEAVVRGRVVDPSGAGLAGASVQPSTLAGPLPEVVTDSEGAFAFEARGSDAGRVLVRASGFVGAERAWSTAASGLLVVELRPSRSEELSVTAARGVAPLADTAASVFVLTRAQIAASPALTVDDVLRQVPGFSLFRRSGSRVANPTTQGASLRGVGPSGTSRTLVLLDGIPLNDPFGGWVYWSRLPRVALDRLEVVEGGASELYGSAALGGVVQAFARADAPSLAFEAAAGNEKTGAASVYAAGQRGDFGARFAGELFTTEGYVLVADAERGSVDTPAGSSHLNGVLSLDRRPQQGLSAFLRAAAFGESRTNGTPLQDNDTDLRELSGGADTALLGGSLTGRAFFGTEVYKQSFSAVAADRASETLTRLQRVPTTSAGGSLIWSRPLAGAHVLVAGAEARYVEGRSDETAFAQGRATTSLSSGGRQWTLAAFGEGRLRFGKKTLATFGLRLDHWSEAEGFSRAQPVSGGTTTQTRYDDRSVSALSPRVSLLFRAAPRWQVFAAGYGAFRAPTLNELYRSFRVGATLTLANPGLTHERLAGGELGLRWTSQDERLQLRGLGFLARLEDPVANVTRSTTPSLVTRQRQNLGRTRSAGAELDLDLQLLAHLRTGLGYALTSATVQSFAAEPSLEGNDVPQVPRHQGTLSLEYAAPRGLALSLVARLVSQQFEDDQNQLPLAGFFSLDARAAWRFGRRVDLFAACENVTGQRYEVGRTPVTNLGPPFLLRAGLRFDGRGASR